MAPHRKSPRSRRNLMVIDPLTTSQGHQVDHRLIFFSLSWSATAYPLKFYMPHDHVQKIKFLTPHQGLMGWGIKKCAGACVIHVSNSHTKSGWISEKKFDPQPPTVPKVPRLGMTKVAEWKSSLRWYISFICEKIHEVWFKNLWNWHCNWNLMVFNDTSPFGPCPGPQGRGKKKVPLHAPFMWATHTPKG